MKITYGRDVTSISDEFILLGRWLFCSWEASTNFRTAERAGSLTIQSGTPAATLVDFFPAMKSVTFSSRHQQKNDIN